MRTPIPFLKGDEPWFVASQQGAQIYVRFWGDKTTWWPLVFVEMDTGLAKIDVCGKTDNIHLDDCAELRIEGGHIIEHGDFCDYQRMPAKPTTPSQP